MPESEPLVSVCLQTYQQAEHIRQAIESVLMQKTTFAFELIIGEDESTDGTREICRSYAEKFPGIIRLFENSRKNVIHIEGKPTGRYNMLNNLKQVRGKYIALLEGDDYWTSENKLQKQADVLRAEQDVIICFHETERHYDASYQKPNDLVTVSALDAHVKTYYTIEDFTVKEWFMATASVMFRNQLPEPLPDFMYESISGDIPLYYILLRAGGRIKMLPDIMAVYRKNKGGITTQLNYHTQVYNNRIALYNKLKPYYNHAHDRVFDHHISFFQKKLSPQKPSLVQRIIRKLKG